MQLIKETSPYIRKKASVKRMMLDVLIALLPLVIFSTFYFGPKTLLIVFISAIVMISSELVYWRLRDKKYKFTINNFLSPLVSAVIYSLLLPVDLNLMYVAFGAFLGIFLGKLVFGGLGSNIFNPAALGRIIVSLCFGSTFVYRHIVSGATPLTLYDMSPGIFEFFSNGYPLKDLFLGTIPGTLGETSKILIILGGLYLFLRLSADFRVTIALILTFSVLVFITGTAFLDMNYAFKLLFFQLFSGGLLFGAFFMVTDPVTSPVTGRGRIIFGMLAGFLVFIIRFYGAYPEGMAFAVLLCNMLVPLIDYHKFSYPKMTKNYWIFLSILSALMILIAFCAAVL